MFNKVILISVMLIFSGCATMVAPDKKTIEISSNPQGVKCHIESEEGKVKSKSRETPFYVTVHDNEYNQKVVCDNNMRADLKDSLHGATLVNLWTWTFPALMAIDYLMGAMFEYEDTHVTE